MKIKVLGKTHTFRLANLKRRFFRLLSRIWFVPFGFYDGPLRKSNVMPHPLVPRDYRDLTLHKMMFQDNYLRAVVSDKIAAQGWVKERVGEKYLIPIYDICDRPEDLRFDDYPLPCVIKSNHACGHVHFVHKPEDFDGIIEKARGWLSKPYQPKTEWAYRDIERKLVVEKMLTDANGNSPADIKIHCFYGEPVMIVYIPNRHDSFTIHYFDKHWKAMETDAAAKSTALPPPKPPELDQILYLVKELTAEFDVIRLDLYIHEGQVYFGELTNFSMGGARHPHTLDYMLLPLYKKLGQQKIEAERARYSAMVG